jgi:hypothetical protein
LLQGIPKGKLIWLWAITGANIISYAEELLDLVPGRIPFLDFLQRQLFWHEYKV